MLDQVTHMNCTFDPFNLSKNGKKENDSQISRLLRVLRHYFCIEVKTQTTVFVFENS